MKYSHQFFLLVSALLTPLVAQTPANTDGDWPKEIDTDQIHVVMYQPQVDRWQDDRLEARSAVVVTQPGDPKQMFGVVSIQARTDVDRETRMVVLRDIEVKSADFPAAASLQPMLLRAVRESVPFWPRTISLDRLLADLALTQPPAQAETAQLKNDPPRIFFSSVPAVLIIIDGEPVYRPVEGTRYTRVMNTLALLLFDPAAGTFYLDGNQWWMTARALNGPWTTLSNPPSDLDLIRAQVTGQEEAEQPPAPAVVGEPPSVVYISTVPAELIVTRGAPQYSPIPKTNLLYVTNTESDLFMDTKSQQYFVLLAGRWFTAKSTSGPWEWVPGAKMPKEFSRIPPEGPKAHVLASIPGTRQAQEAVIANQIPQMATVKRSEAKLEVRYSGPPRFEPIPGTSMEYAVNTPTEVIHAEGRYYAVDRGVWFVSDSPLGPWVVADMIPAVIYTIPPSSPLYRVRFVRIYGATPEYVYVGYTPGYLGAYVYDGVVVFGTGWWYPGVMCGDFWCGWPWTWGFGFQFSYWSGGWFWRPMRTYWWYHNPPYAHRVYVGRWNPHWRGASPLWIRNNVNVYRRWSPNVVARAVIPAPRAPAARPGVPSGTAPRQAPGAPPARAPRPDLYAGPDGRVYQRTPQGWSTQNPSGQWQRVPATPSLEQQRRSRELGQSRHDEFRRQGQAPGIPRTTAPPARMPAPSRPQAPSRQPSGRGGRER